MKAEQTLRLYAASLGWEFLRYGAAHEIWQSPSGKKMSLPGSIKGKRTLQNIRSKLRRFT